MAPGIRTLCVMIGAVALSACGARSSLLDVDTWLEDRRRDEESSAGAGDPLPLDPAHDEACGKGLHGPLMVTIPVPGGGSFCIDSTETTIRQYRAFLQAEFPFSNQPSYCAWNQSYDSWQPAYGGAGRHPPAPDDYPTNSLDWCDAYSYCAWSGKRLCGKIGGGHLVNENPDSEIELHPLDGEWTYACSAGGTRTYPYGNVYDPTACVNQGYDGDPNFNQYMDIPRPIHEAKKCVGGFPGLYDMGGNATEWVDESDKVTGKSDFVVSFGGYWGSDAMEARCVVRLAGRRATAYGATGIRCCKDGPS